MKTAKGVRDMEVLKTARWITLAEAAAYSRKSAKTILRWIDEGMIRGINRGEWIIDRESIDAFFCAPTADVKELFRDLQRRKTA